MDGHGRGHIQSFQLPADRKGARLCQLSAVIIRPVHIDFISRSIAVSHCHALRELWLFIDVDIIVSRNTIAFQISLAAVFRLARRHARAS